MKNTILILLSVFYAAISNAQIAPDTYLVYFKDKANNEYSIEKPEEFLSTRAIEHRKKFNIAITEQDLPVNKNYIDKLEKLGLEVYMTSKWFNLAVIKTSNKKLLKKVKKLNFVIKEPTMYKKQSTTGDTSYIAPKFDSLKVFEKDTLNYGTSSTQAKMININYLHNMGYMGEGMQIAVLDAGFKRADKLPAFDSLFANKQILGIRDFVSKDDEVYANDSHGMMVLSTMGGNIPGELVGTAPKANFWLIRTEEAASEHLIEEYFWIAGAEFADSLGCDIIHTSLGYNDFDYKSNNHTYKDMDGDTAPISIAADIASAKGILVVTSAGNDGFSAWKYITAPADADSVLTVGAANKNRNLAYFSSRGPTYDKRVKPDAVAMGMWSVVQGNDGKISTASGTSFSGPIIAGAAACLWQANPTFTNMEIINAIRKSGDRYEKPDGNFGFGIPDFGKADAYLKSITNK